MPKYTLGAFSSHYYVSCFSRILKCCVSVLPQYDTLFNLSRLPLGNYVEVYCLVPMCWEIFPVIFLLFISSLILEINVVREHILHDFTCFKFDKAVYGTGHGLCQDVFCCQVKVNCSLMLLREM